LLQAQFEIQITDSSQGMESKKKMKVAKLNDNIIFTLLCCDPIADAGAPDFKPLQPSDHIKKANNRFEKMGYNTSKSKLPNEKGKSKRIASQSTKSMKPAATKSSSRVDLHKSLFPSITWATTIPTLTHHH
jgi:hypothetical protein